MRWVSYSERLPSITDADCDGNVLRARRRSNGSFMVTGVASQSRIPSNPLSEWFWLEGAARPPRPVSENYWQPECSKIVPRIDGTVLDYSQPVGLQGFSATRVRIFTFEAEGKWPIQGQYKAIEWNTMKWQADGTASSGSEAFRLINIPREYEATLWVNYYADGFFLMYRSKEEADRESRPGRVACTCVKGLAKDGEGIDAASLSPVGETRAIDLSDLASNSDSIEVPF